MTHMTRWLAHCLSGFHLIVESNSRMVRFCISTVFTGLDAALIRGIPYNLKTTIPKVLNRTGNVFSSTKLLL